ASLTDTSSGRCRSIWPVSSSRLDPAARDTTVNRPGSASTTDKHCRPMEPVEPRMASLFTSCDFPRARAGGFADSCPRRAKPCPIIPDNRNRQNQRVDAVQNPPVSGKQRTRILHTGTALVRRLQQIAGLAKEIPGSRHPQSLHDGNINPPSEGPARKERREQARDCPFPGLLRAQVRRQLVPADGPSHKVGGSVPNPHNNQSKEQQPRPHALDPVKPDGEAQRERKEQQRARADSHRGQAFHQRPPRPEGQRGNSQNKDKEKIYRRGRNSTQARRSRSRSGTPGARSRRQARSIRKGPAALPEQWPAKQPPWSSTN